MHDTVPHSPHCRNVFARIGAIKVAHVVGVVVRGGWVAWDLVQMHTCAGVGQHVQEAVVGLVAHAPATTDRTQSSHAPKHAHNLTQTLAHV